MASVHKLLPSAIEFYTDLQHTADIAENNRHERFKAVMTMIRITRGWLIRKHVAWLSKNARTIQCAFRIHMARKAIRAALRRAVRAKHSRHYAKAATTIEVHVWLFYRILLFCDSFFMVFKPHYSILF